MYSIRVEPLDKRSLVIDRRMSSNTALEMIPTVMEICRRKFGMVAPVALPMGNDVYRIFDIDTPYLYAKVTITKDAN